jgi:amino acid transporter
VAALNGILAQLVMASRVLMGMGRRYRGMRSLALINPRFGTPVLATILVGTVVVAISVTAPVQVLAEITSFLLLLIFVLINTSLIVLKRKSDSSGFEVPLWVPVLGVLGSLLALIATIFWG